MTESSFRNLTVWQKAIVLTVSVYATTNKFPKTEQFALTSQMQRAAVSIPSNIAEGTGRGSKKDFAQFVSIAIGSVSELETQIELSHRLGYASKSEATDLSEQTVVVKRMLVALRASLMR